VAILVLAILLAAWGLVLGPALLRQSLEPSPIQTEMMFRRALRAIGSTPRRGSGAVGGRSVLVPPKSQYPLADLGGPSHPRTQTAAVRRRRNLTYLATFTIVTFALGLLVRPLGFLLYVNIVADVALVAYLVAVVYFAARPPEGGTISHPYLTEDVSPPDVAGGAIG